MKVGDITELRIEAVLKKGVPNEECVAIKAYKQTNLGQYGIMLGVYDGSNGVFPFRDNLFWFGDGILEEGDWIFIYTGAGKPTKTTDEDGNVYTIYWGKSVTAFADTRISPLLFRVDAVDILAPPENLPQIGNDKV